MVNWVPFWHQSRGNRSGPWVWNRTSGRDEPSILGKLQFLLGRSPEFRSLINWAGAVIVIQISWIVFSMSWPTDWAGNTKLTSASMAPYWGGIRCNEPMGMEPWAKNGPVPNMGWGVAWKLSTKEAAMGTNNDMVLWLASWVTVGCLDEAFSTQNSRWVILARKSFHPKASLFLMWTPNWMERAKANTDKAMANKLTTKHTKGGLLAKQLRTDMIADDSPPKYFALHPDGYKRLMLHEREREDGRSRNYSRFWWLIGKGEKGGNDGQVIRILKYLSLTKLT